MPCTSCILSLSQVPLASFSFNHQTSVCTPRPLQSQWKHRSIPGATDLPSPNADRTLQGRCPANKSEKSVSECFLYSHGSLCDSPWQTAWPLEAPAHFGPLIQPAQGVTTDIWRHSDKAQLIVFSHPTHVFVLPLCCFTTNPPAPVGAKGRVFPEALATGSFS